MRKSQIELWMLSKFAILFFILALAIFLFTVSQSEKSGLCSVEAGSQAQIISNSISNVLNNPIEDQQLVVKLPSAITLGSGLSAYLVNITYTNQSAGPSLIAVQAFSNTGNCVSNPQTVSFSSNVNVNFIDVNGDNLPLSPVKNTNINQMVLSANPSFVSLPNQFFLLVIKCTSKSKPTLPPYLFVITCVQTKLSLCSGYGIYNTNNLLINKACGFS